MAPRGPGKTEKMPTVSSHYIYLDYAGAHPPLPEIVAMHGRLCDEYRANPHAGSRYSEVSRRAVLQAARRLLTVLGIEEDEAEVIWTSGGTESNNLALLGGAAGLVPGCVTVDGAAHAAMLEPCRQIPSIFSCWSCLECHHDAAGIPLLDEGNVRPETARVVAFCHTNNETGVVTDLAAVRDWMRYAAPQALLVVDGVQSFTKLAIPWQAAGIDLLSISGRKIGGPASCGALVRRRGIELRPLLYGGGQQGTIRPGTLDVVGILEFVAAAETAISRQSDTREKVTVLNQTLRDLLAGLDSRIVILSPPEASPYILSFSLPGFEGAVLMRMLAEDHIVIGAGSACSAEKGETSHVLRSMGYSEAAARGLLRVSFAQDSSAGDIHALAASLARAIARY